MNRAPEPIHPWYMHAPHPDTGQRRPAGAQPLPGHRISARLLQSMYAPLEADRQENPGGDLESDQQLWERKSQEAGEYGLTRSIQKHGVLSAVQLQDWDVHADKLSPAGRPQVLGGHHRIAAAHPDTPIPVNYHNDIVQARSDPNREYDEDVSHLDPEFTGRHEQSPAYGGYQPPAPGGTRTGQQVIRPRQRGAAPAATAGTAPTVGRPARTDRLRAPYEPLGRVA